MTDPLRDQVRKWSPGDVVPVVYPSRPGPFLLEDADILAGFLSEWLGVDVEAQVPTDYQAVIVALQTGAADIGGGFGPVNVARAMDQAGAEPILQSERFGEFLYVTQWFTNDPDTFCGDEPVEETYESDGEEYTLLFCNGVNELQTSEEGPIGLEFLENAGDVTISFVSPGSASGEVFPAYGLIEMGFDLDELDTMYAGGHPESALAVYNGELHVSGNLSNSGGSGTPLSNVARWDGSTWHALGGGTDATVRALAVCDPDGGLPLAGHGRGAAPLAGRRGRYQMREPASPVLGAPA
jgi:phosphonate transport system substrate-binding protein